MSNPYDPIKLKCHGGPYHGATLRHYPTSTVTEQGKKYYFEDLALDDGVYELGDIGAKIVEAHWRPRD